VRRRVGGESGVGVAGAAGGRFYYFYIHVGDIIALCFCGVGFVWGSGAKKTAASVPLPAKRGEENRNSQSRDTEEAIIISCRQILCKQKGEAAKDNNGTSPLWTE